ncbi:site-2 protease family protein [Chloroflexi bacterium TSY]|nr:site-2 protease family protein [Chloroflexi bacterium TSY]
MTKETNTFPFLQTSEAVPSNPQTIADEVRAVVAPELAVDYVEFPREPQKEGMVALRGRLQQPSTKAFPRWLTELNRRGYTPLLRPDRDGATPDHVILRVIRGVVPKTEQRATIHIILFAVTFISTLFAGAVNGVGNGTIQVDSLEELFLPQNLIQGWPFALTLLSILTAHEFGHYFAARYHNVAVTLPYFIPLPPPIGLFGTLGAFIRLKEPISDRRKLFDIGVAGPLAGLALAVPLLFLGLSTSPLIEITSPGWLEGNSLLYYYAKLSIFGMPLPNPETGQDVLMNQVTFAAWTGLLVTALNLLPVGQLDGGHTVFSLFGERSRYINLATLGMMAVLGIAGIPYIQEVISGLESVGFMGWFLWIGLIFYVIGPFHPPALDDVTKLDQTRRVVGYFVIIIFILTFIPVPLRQI